MSTRELTFAQAIREALDEEMARDETIFVLGEDVGAWGGVFRCTEGLFQKYGGDPQVPDQAAAFCADPAWQED